MRRGYDKTHRADSPGGGYPRASVAVPGTKARFNRDLDLEGAGGAAGGAAGRKSAIYPLVMGGGLAAAGDTSRASIASRSPRKSLSPGRTAQGFRKTLTTRPADEVDGKENPYGPLMHPHPNDPYGWQYRHAAAV